MRGAQALLALLALLALFGRAVALSARQELRLLQTLAHGEESVLAKVAGSKIPRELFESLGTRSLADAEGEDDIPIASNCYKQTPSTYEGVNVSYCYANSNKAYLEHPPAECLSNVSNLVFVNGQFSADQTFYNCLANVPDSPSMPTFYNGSLNGCSFLYTSITPVNLVQIDEIQGTARLQIIVNFFWNDYRYNMPLYWQHMKDSYSGVDLTNILTNQSVVMWLPQVTFPDASDITMQSQTYSMIANGFFYYSASYDMTLMQPLFDFRKYPRDTQDIVVRYSALNYDAAELQLYPIGVYCSYLQDGSCSFAHNPIWSYRASENYCSVYYDKRENSVWQSYAVYTVTVERSPRGVTLRLVVPLALLILLSGLTFWIAYEHRVDVTITLLLAISALYVVIIQNIPMVGYLTTVDQFVLTMFLLLCSVATCHQVYFTLHEKAHLWPLRLIYLRLIELFGRTVVIPVVVISISLTVRIDLGGFQLNHLVGTALLVSLVILVRECIGVRTAAGHAVEKLKEKAHASPKLADLSLLEVCVLNRHFFGTWSLSRTRMLTHLTQSCFATPVGGDPYQRPRDPPEQPREQLRGALFPISHPPAIPHNAVAPEQATSPARMEVASLELVTGGGGGSLRNRKWGELVVPAGDQLV